MAAGYQLHPHSDFLISAICCFLSYTTLDKSISDPNLLTVRLSIDSVGGLARLLLALFYVQQGQTIVTIISRILLEPFNKTHRWLTRSIAVCCIIAILSSATARSGVLRTNYVHYDDEMIQLGSLLSSFLLSYLFWASLLYNARIQTSNAAFKHDRGQMGSGKQKTHDNNDLPSASFDYSTDLSQTTFLWPKWRTSTTLVNTILGSLLVSFVRSIYERSQEATKQWSTTSSKDAFHLFNSLFTAGSALIGAVLVGIYQFRFVRRYGWV